MLTPFFRAVGFADGAHGHQLDKGGQPYLCHCLRVGVSLLPDVDAAIVGVLHDVLEDTDTTPAQLHDFLAGFSSGLFSPCITLTKSPNENYAAYLDRVSRDPLALRVKVADLCDNLLPNRIGAAEATGADVLPLLQKYIDALRLLPIPDELRVVHCVDRRLEQAVRMKDTWPSWRTRETSKISLTEAVNRAREASHPQLPTTPVHFAGGIDAV